MIDVDLKSDQSVDQIERHDKILKMTVTDVKDDLSLIVFTDLYLVIDILKINLQENSRVRLINDSTESIQNQFGLGLESD